jgi:hypothetical protein
MDSPAQTARVFWWWGDAGDPGADAGGDWVEWGDVDGAGAGGVMVGWVYTESPCFRVVRMHSIRGDNFLLPRPADMRWIAGEHVMTEKLTKLVEAARLRPFPEEEREAQRRSFAYGNASIANDRVTIEMIIEVDEQIKARLHTR